MEFLRVRLQVVDIIYRFSTNVYVNPTLYFSLLLPPYLKKKIGYHESLQNFPKITTAATYELHLSRISRYFSQVQINDIRENI